MKVTYGAVARHSGYWISVILDLPERSKADRAQGSQFKSFLKQRGFQMLQPSLYLKFAFTEASAKSACESVLKFSPKKGKMTVLRMTDLQFQGRFPQCQRRVRWLQSSNSCRKSGYGM